MGDEAVDQPRSSDGTSLPVEEHYPAIASSVPIARAQCVRIAETLGASAQRLDDIALATSEALSNAVLHAYRPIGAGDIILRVRLDSAQQLEVTIEDSGVGLGNANTPGGAGQGLLLMQQMSDRLRVTRRGAGTLVTMSFRLSD
jgi:anti-sigma regulatory factor (Ser/Thr protein kinase)